MNNKIRNSVELVANSLPFCECRILSSAHQDIRYNGSSGGFVTELADSLFFQNKIASAICFHFSGKELFVPQVVFSSRQYNQTGSIYHETGLIRFLKDNISSIKSPVFITCLPCQCEAIRRLLRSYQIESILVSLVCSGQLKKQATYDFLALHGIASDQLKSFQYRGKGWPSGIHAETKDGKTFFFHNTDSDWKCFFHSAIYNLERCFHCMDSYGTDADFSVADPWFKEYIEKETIGCTVVCASEKKWMEWIDEMIAEGRLTLHQKISLSEFVESQFWTLAKKESYRKFFFLKKAVRIFRMQFYRRLFLTGNFRFWHYTVLMRRLRKYKRKLHA